MKTKTVKITLEGFGSYLGMEKGCFVVKDRNGNMDKYPLFESEIGEIQVKSGNFLSSGALAACGFWEIDCLFLTQKGRPVAMLRSLDDDSHVKTRVCQYEALKTEKAVHISARASHARCKDALAGSSVMRLYLFCVVVLGARWVWDHEAKIGNSLKSVNNCPCNPRSFPRLFSCMVGVRLFGANCDDWCRAFDNSHSLPFF